MKKLRSILREFKTDSQGNPIYPVPESNLTVGDTVKINKSHHRFHGEVGRIYAKDGDIYHVEHENGIKLLGSHHAQHLEKIE